MARRLRGLSNTKKRTATSRPMPNFLVQRSICVKSHFVLRAAPISSLPWTKSRAVLFRTTPSESLPRNRNRNQILACPHLGVGNVEVESFDGGFECDHVATFACKDACFAQIQVRGQLRPTFRRLR